MTGSGIEYSTSLDYVDFSYYLVTLAIFSLCIICGVPIYKTRDMPYFYVAGSL